MSTLLSVEKLSIYRRQNPILENISLVIQESDFTTIVGPNGAGKSMLVKCLAACIKPDEGIIKREAGLVIGYVPQRMYPDFSIPIYTQSFLSLRRQPLLIKEAIAETGIESLLSIPLSSLSGGELQRVLLTRALAHNPNLLILDEPAQNLDINEQFAFYRLLEKIYQKRQIAILMVSHDLHLVMRQTRQVICLYRHICCQGEPQTVTRDPKFISLFGDEVANLMALYQHSVTGHTHSHPPSVVE